MASPATALLMLDRYVDLKAGDWLVQSAANSAVGSAVVQLARARGVRTVNIVRREAVVAGLTALGADVVLGAGALMRAVDGDSFAGSDITVLVAEKYVDIHNQHVGRRIIAEFTPNELQVQQ